MLFGDREVDRRTNIVVDDQLVSEAMRLTGASSMREVVDLALRDLVAKKKRRDITQLAGKIKFVDDFDPKEGFG